MRDEKFCEVCVNHNQKLQREERAIDITIGDRLRRNRVLLEQSRPGDRYQEPNSSTTIQLVMSAQRQDRDPRVSNLPSRIINAQDTTSATNPIVFPDCVVADNGFCAGNLTAAVVPAESSENHHLDYVQVKIAVGILEALIHIGLVRSHFTLTQHRLLSLL